MAWGGAVLVGSTYNVNFLFLPHYQSTGMWMNFVLGGGEEQVPELSAQKHVPQSPEGGPPWDRLPAHS